MKVLIFNGSNDNRAHTTAYKVSDYFSRQLVENGHSVQLFNVAEAHIPFFDMTLTKPPIAVEIMCDAFTDADAHIWLTPLYHGGMTGAMKNCLDWLELTSKSPVPYLTGKVVGLVCWADGGFALQGINAMDAVAKSLRAWVLPYTIPLVKSELYNDNKTLSKRSTDKFDLMINLLTASKTIETAPMAL